MSFENEINGLYEQIAHDVNDMIPVDWETFYFNGEVTNGSGGVYFFFKPKSDDRNTVFSHYIPQIYNLDKKSYNRGLQNLFQLTAEMQKIFIENDQDPWFSITIIVNSSGKLKVHFDYTNWTESEFGPSARIKYFDFKYINGKSENKKEQDLIDKMKKYEN